MSKAKKPAAPAVDNTHTEAMEMVKRLIAIGRSIEIDIPHTLAERKALAVTQLGAIEESGAKLGFTLLTIRAEMDRGEWQGWCEQDLKLHPRSAQRYMQVARMLQSLPEGKATRVSLFPLRKQIELARLRVEDVQSMIDEGDLEEAADMPEMEFKTLLQLRKRMEKLEQKAVMAAEGRLQLERKAQRSAHYNPAGLVTRLRLVCSEEAEAIQALTVGVLAEVAEAMKTIPPEADGRPVADALMPMFWSLHATVQQINALRRDLMQRYARYVDSDATALPPLLTVEDIRAVEDYEASVKRQQALRRAARAAR